MLSAGGESARGVREFPAGDLGHAHLSALPEAGLPL